MLRARDSRSGWPCGSRLRWVTLAPVKSIAAPFGQAATQAPQPMQIAASIASSWTAGATGWEFGSGWGPVVVLM